MAMYFVAYEQALLGMSLGISIHVTCAACGDGSGSLREAISCVILYADVACLQVALLVIYAGLCSLHSLACSCTAFLYEPMACVQTWAVLICRQLVLPVMQGTENLPSREEVRPLLFVGNHSRMGVYDLPWVLSELYMRGYKVSWLACMRKGDNSIF